jgi:hypothetical protein
MTQKDLIARASTLGEILKMMPGAPVDDECLREALSAMKPGDKIGEVLLGMRVITIDQLNRALTLQEKMRSCKGIDEVAEFFEEIRRAANAAREHAFAALPNTNPGVTT